MEWLRGSSPSSAGSSLLSDAAAPSPPSVPASHSKSTALATSSAAGPSGRTGSSSSSSNPLLSLSSSSLPLLPPSPSSSPLATVSTSILSRSTGSLSRLSCPLSLSAETRSAPSPPAAAAAAAMSPSRTLIGTNPALSSQSSWTTRTAGMPSGSPHSPSGWSGGRSHLAAATAPKRTPGVDGLKCRPYGTSILPRFSYPVGVWTTS
mmetsp:Transcript_24527/g.55983  ORF Transcript_24527/g.55983 Transcript_24527/m.55983 type:complete len:206 (-) Transcript_24527:508-1125(-)